jgi:hypothetical protein
MPPVSDSLLAGRFQMRAEDLGRLRQAKHVWMEKTADAQTAWRTDQGADISGSFVGGETPVGTQDKA